MPDLSPEQREQVIDDLTALDWTRDLEVRSIQVISERLNCPDEDAELILQRLILTRLIHEVSESGAMPAIGRRFGSYGWRWARGPR